MNIILNGDSYNTADGITVTALLTELQVTGPVAVEINKVICSKKVHHETVLNDGDVVEVVTAVGGG